MDFYETASYAGAKTYLGTGINNRHGVISLLTIYLNILIKNFIIRYSSRNNLNRRLKTNDVGRVGNFADKPPEIGL